MEDLVVKIGYDPKYINVAEEIIKKKNIDIAVLRKSLKLPAIEDASTNGIEENEIQKDDMMKLIIEKNIQIRQMKA